MENLGRSHKHEGPWTIPVTANGALITDGLFSEHDGDRMVEVVPRSHLKGAVKAYREACDERDQWRDRAIAAEAKYAEAVDTVRHQAGGQ